MLRKGKIDEVIGCSRYKERCLFRIQITKLPYGTSSTT